MLACARIGAIHSVVFGGFAAKELATRIDDCKPKLILSASCGIEAGARRPLQAAARRRRSTSRKHKPEACLILQRPQREARADRRPRPRLGDAARRRAARRTSPRRCVPVLATDPLYILYTSGTTGIPKGVVRDNGGHMVALNWSMKNLYGVEPGEVYWAASDIGWVVGHSYIVYAPLLHGCTTILYEGKPVGTPDAGAFWRVIAEHKCVAMFTAPTAFRAIKKEDPQGKLFAQYDLSKFRTLFLAGERADPRHDRMGREAAEGAGDRSLVADRDRLGDRRQSGGPRPAAGEARLADRARCRATTCASSTSSARKCRAARWARSSSSCRCRRRACRRCGSRTSASRKATSPNSPATTRPPTPASRTRTATSSSWAAPTTSSTSRATGSRPAAWRRCWPATRTSPNAR